VKLKNQEGFTLAELLVVTSIIAIISTVGYGRYQTYLFKAKRVSVTLTLSEIQKQTMLIMAEDEGMVKLFDNCAGEADPNAAEGCLLSKWADEDDCNIPNNVLGLKVNCKLKYYYRLVVNADNPDEFYVYAAEKPKERQDLCGNAKKRHMMIFDSCGSICHVQNYTPNNPCSIVKNTCDGFSCGF